MRAQSPIGPDETPHLHFSNFVWFIGPPNTVTRQRDGSKSRGCIAWRAVRGRRTCRHGLHPRRSEGTATAQRPPAVPLACVAHTAGCPPGRQLKSPAWPRRGEPKPDQSQESEPPARAKFGTHGRYSGAAPPPRYKPPRRLPPLLGSSRLAVRIHPASSVPCARPPRA